VTGRKIPKYKRMIGRLLSFNLQKGNISYNYINKKDADIESRKPKNAVKSKLYYPPVY